jgi:hypothetical protein
MNISRLIEELEALKDAHGDIPVLCCAYPISSIEINDYHYDSEENEIEEKHVNIEY